MPRRFIGPVLGALAMTAVAAPLAHAAAPARVHVRVEAPGRTVADAMLTTSRAAVRPDGAHACTGTSAGGALWQATKGAGGWSGSWFASLNDFAVERVGGVRAPADFSAYWTLWLNGRPATTGVCGTELEAGDDVLEFLCTATADFSSCTNLPLALRVVRPPGDKVQVAVVRLKGDGTSTPVAGASVSGGLQPVRTAANGTATVRLRDGQSTLRATHAGDVPSARLHCHRGANDGGCGSRDRTPPTLRLGGIADGAAFDAAHAPRVLRGTATDPEGATVALRLTRRHDGACTRFDAQRGAFRPCARAPRAPFAAGDRRRWSYLLPAKLGPGAYRLDAIATDGAGNRRALHVAFTVAD